MGISGDLLSGHCPPSKLRPSYAVYFLLKVPDGDLGFQSCKLISVCVHGVRRFKLLFLIPCCFFDWELLWAKLDYTYGLLLSFPNRARSDSPGPFQVMEISVLGWGALGGVLSPLSHQLLSQSELAPMHLRTSGRNSQYMLV